MPPIRRPRGKWEPDSPKDEIKRQKVEHVPGPTRRATYAQLVNRLWNASAPRDSLEVVTSELNFARAQLDLLIRYIGEKIIPVRQIPPSVRYIVYSRRGIVLQHQIRRAYARVMRDDSATHDDLDRALEGFIEKTYDFGYLGHGDAERETARIVEIVRECLVTAQLEWTAYHPRNDRRWDALLRHLIVSSGGAVFHRAQLLKELDEEADKVALATGNVNNWFSLSRQALSVAMDIEYDT